jgi:hypothetical protein
VVRWVALLVLVVSASASARMRIVMLDPPVVRGCPRAATWDAVAACLKKHGSPTVMKTLPMARLVHLELRGNGAASDGGVYLYMQNAKGWRLAGMYQNRGSEYEVLGFEKVTVGTHVGYRVDVGQLMRTQVQPDGFTNVPALFSLHQAMFCGGDSWRCTEVVASCDVFVHGGALWTFRGTVSLAENMVRITGDRSHVGPLCSAPEQEPLGWTQ